jgi:PKD repeat protein
MTPGSFYASGNEVIAVKRVRVVLQAGLVGALAFGVAGCWLFMPPNQPPVAVFTAAPMTGVAPLPVAFDASSSVDSDGTITTYTWDFGDGQTGAGESGSHVFTVEGTFTVELTVVDDDGAIDTTSKTINVAAPENALPEANISVSPTTGPAPLAVTFNANGSTDADGTITAYSWDFGDGNSGAGATAMHTYTAPGVFAVVLTVTDNEGAADDDTVIITVTAPGNQAPIPSVSATPEAGVAPLTVDFDATASSDPDGAITAYEWYFGDGDNGTGATVSHTYASAGTYTAILTVLDDDGTPASTTVEITVFLDFIVLPLFPVISL